MNNNDAPEFGRFNKTLDLGPLGYDEERRLVEHFSRAHAPSWVNPRDDSDLISIVMGTTVGIVLAGWIVGVIVAALGRELPW